MNGIEMLNFSVVGIFGVILSAAFSGILWTRQKRVILAGGLTVILVLQGVLRLFVGLPVLVRLYPVITHLPLAVILCALGKKCLWSFISVLTAYLCCQIRRWLALLAVAVFSGGPLMQSAMELALTLPLLLLLVRFAAPAVRSVSRYTTLIQCQFGLIPVLYYGFDYLTRIYTDLLTEGAMVAVEFMPFVCSVAYLIFVLHISAAERVHSELEQVQSSLHIQVVQAVREIESLRAAQQKASTYRHDLRHHMRYLSACIEHGRLEQAQTYIREICSEIAGNTVTVFCENEAVNLILSAFAGRAGDYGIAMRIRAEIPQAVSVSESDLCVLLSNALENALYACQRRREKGLSAVITVSACEKKGKFLLQIVNSCDADITFVRGIPVTDRPGHGIGVRSICAIAEKYGGICTFSAEDGNFTLRVCL